MFSHRNGIMNSLHGGLDQVHLSPYESISDFVDLKVYEHVYTLGCVLVE